MFRTIEQTIFGALKNVPGLDIDIFTGPIPQPDEDLKKSRVSIHAENIHIIPIPSDKDIESTRSDSTYRTTYTWKGDGTTREFIIPSDIKDQLFELETPPGTIKESGRDYQKYNNTIVFVYPPALDQDIRATFIGNPSGYQERRESEIQLILTTWSAHRESMDELLQILLAMGLIVLSNINTINLTSSIMENFNARILKPISTLHSIERSVLTNNNRIFYMGTITIIIKGEYDLWMSIGEPEKVGKIENIQYEHDILMNE